MYLLASGNYNGRTIPSGNIRRSKLTFRNLKAVLFLVTHDLYLLTCVLLLSRTQLLYYSGRDRRKCAHKTRLYIVVYLDPTILLCSGVVRAASGAPRFPVLQLFPTHSHSCMPYNSETSHLPV